MGTNETNYLVKLKAFLHDPVHKIWSFKNVKDDDITHKEVLEIKNIKFHEKIALELFKFIFPEDNLDDKKISNADRIASSLSRIVVSPQIGKEEYKKFFNEGENNELFETVQFIDPFRGREENIQNPEKHEEVKNFFENLGKLFNDNKDSEEKAKGIYLFLWRFLPDIFPWIEKHPADSRSPNHSIYDHLVQTSAITTCIENNDKPSFLLFTITPVQSFIATARKTSDLGAGSYFLSYLIYKAIEVIMEEFGPDNIIFPNLRGQPLVDKWLYEKYFKNVTEENKKDENNELDKYVFTKWKEEWDKLSSQDGNDFIAQKLSIANFPNRFLAIIPYSKAKEIAQKCKDNLKNIIEELISEYLDNNSSSETKSEIKKEIEKVKQNIINHITSYLKSYYVIVPFYQNDPNNIDIIIDEFKNLNGKNYLLETINIIKTYPYYKKANIGSVYSLLVELTEKFLVSRKMLKDFTIIPEQKGEKCHLCGEYDILDIDWSKLSLYYVNSTERLCGVCLFKRLLPDILKEKYKINAKYPSTSEMATVTYKKCLDKGKIDNFIRKFNETFQNKQKLPWSISVPALKDNTLFKIDGQWLMESSYRKEYLKKELGINIEENKLEEMRKFLKNNQINPPVYYAILAMDGDNMGKWLNGNYMPKVKELIHPKVADILERHSEKDKDLFTLLNSNHPMSPSFHNQFSRRLSEFALNYVRRVVEDEYYGKLIYAGGDDVLAFLPVEKAVDCGYKLNERFKEILGEKASISAGIVFVHHKYPLSIALEEVRDAEKLAKGQYNRNSVCIKYISGSGQSKVTGMKWEEKEFFDEVIKKYYIEELSSKFAYDFMEVVKEICPTNETINENTHYILTNELKRLYRHKLTKEKYDKEFEEKLIGQLNKFKNNYNSFGDLLIITRFGASLL